MIIINDYEQKKQLKKILDKYPINEADRNFISNLVNDSNNSSSASKHIKVVNISDFIDGIPITINDEDILAAKNYNIIFKLIFENNESFAIPYLYSYNSDRIGCMITMVNYAGHILNDVIILDIVNKQLIIS